MNLNPQDSWKIMNQHFIRWPTRWFTHRVHMGRPRCCLCSKRGNRGSHWTKRRLGQGWFDHLGYLISITNPSINNVISTNKMRLKRGLTRPMSISSVQKSRPLLSTLFQYHLHYHFSIHYMGWSQDCHVSFKDVSLVVGQDDWSPRRFHHQWLG